MKTIECAICGNKQKLRTLYEENFDIKKLDDKTYSARRIPDKTHFRFVVCDRCGLIFSNPIIEESKIRNLYKKSDFTYGLESDYLAKTYFSYLEKYLKGKDLRKIRILDIGCGNGFFLEEVLRRGIKKVYGVEPGKPSVLKANKELRKNIKIDIFKDGLFEKNYFDIICCFHTLDHIVDPNVFLAAALKILKKNGIIYFVVHNTDGLSVKLFGESSPIFDIEHIYLFNKKTLTKILKKNGFSKMQTIDVANNYPLRYWVHLFPLSEFVKNRIQYFLTITKLGKMPLKINAGNIGIIARK